VKTCHWTWTGASPFSQPALPSSVNIIFTSETSLSHKSWAEKLWHKYRETVTAYQVFIGMLFHYWLWDSLLWKTTHHFRKPVIGT
jgi:hypothetical protein